MKESIIRILHNNKPNTGGRKPVLKSAKDRTSIKGLQCYCVIFKNTGYPQPNIICTVATIASYLIKSHGEGGEEVLYYYEILEVQTEYFLQVEESKAK